MSNKPRLGLTFHSPKFKEIKFDIGTADITNIKGCYLNVSGWFTHKDNPNNSLMKFTKKLDRVLRTNKNPNLFGSRHISGKFIPDTYGVVDTSFLEFEYTLFVNRQTDKHELGNELKNLCNKLYEEVVSDNEDFIIVPKRIRK